MLEGIVQKDDFSPLLPKQVLYTFHAVFAHRDLNIGEFPEILQWLVAQILVCALAVSQFKAFRLSSLASAEGGKTIMVAQQCNEVFRVRRFARPTQVEVAHTNHRLFESGRFQKMPII